MFSTNGVDFSRDAFPSGGVAAEPLRAHHGTAYALPLTPVPPTKKKKKKKKKKKEKIGAICDFYDFRDFFTLKRVPDKRNCFMNNEVMKSLYQCHME